MRLRDWEVASSAYQVSAGSSSFSSKAVDRWGACTVLGFALFSIAASEVPSNS